jgi:hypothetical protein
MNCLLMHLLLTHHDKDRHMTHPSDINPPDDQKGGPVPEHSNRVDAQELDLVFAKIHHRVTSVEPVARDLNRHLVDLLGPCPVVIAGETSECSWVTVIEDDNGNFLLQLPLLPVTESLRLSTALAELAKTTDFSSIRRTLPSSAQYQLPFIVSEPVTRVSGHVSAERS